MTRRLRQVVDLYVNGKAISLRDDSRLWVQVLNPFEQDTARNEAQVAKARLTMSLKEFGSDETAKVRMYFLEDGQSEAAAKLVDAKMAEATPRLLDGIRNDPEWTERLQIIERGEQDTAKPLEQIEQDLLLKVTTEFTDELARRLRYEREYLGAKFEEAGEEELWEGYLDWYLERRGAELMLAEFRLHQVFYGTRWCEGTDEGDHTECDGHAARVFASKEEVRTAPADLVGDIMDAFDALELTVREAKNSDRQGSSSESSPLPSEAAESTASTQTETPVAPPGTSPSPSPTPSLSSATAS